MPQAIEGHEPSWLSPQLAADLDLARRIETGRTKPSAADRERLARTLDELRHCTDVLVSAYRRAARRAA